MFVILGIMFATGKGADLVAGYNTMACEQPPAYYCQRPRSPRHRAALQCQDCQERSKIHVFPFHASASAISIMAVNEV